MSVLQRFFMNLPSSKDECVDGLLKKKTFVVSSEGIRTYPLLNQNTLPLSFKNKQAFSNDKCYTFQVFSKKRKILSFSPIFFETVLDFCYIMEPSEFCSYPHTLEIGIENQIMFSFTPYTQALNICLLFM